MNARQELLEHVKGKGVVKFINVEHNGVVIKGTLEEVLPQIDFEYSEGYGFQELYGYIWYLDGTWSSRREYDGAEWWTHNVCPDIES